MKLRLLILSALLAPAVLTSAAVTDTTLNVPYPGALSTMLTHEECQTITSLTLTGEIDNWSDFRFMRESLPVLASLDLSQTTIRNNYSSEYSDNEILSEALSNKKNAKNYKITLICYDNS